VTRGGTGGNVTLRGFPNFRSFPARWNATATCPVIEPETEAVVKGDKTLYRARFAGFQQKDVAEAVCKQLKLNDIDCITIKN